MNKKEIRQYISDIIYCSALSMKANNPKYDKYLEDSIVIAIEYILKLKGVEDE